MHKHLILSTILLAFGLMATCAPTVNLVRRSCSKRATKLQKSPSGSTSRAPRPVSRTSSNRLGRRAPGDISLCGFPLRGHSASACQGNPGYVEVEDPKTRRKVLQWKDWGQFSTTGNECDHPVELQLVKVALESIGFCQAWNGMIQLAASEGHVHISAAELTAIFSTLKVAANDPQGMHYLNKEVNGEKEHFVAQVLERKGAVQMRLAVNSHVLNYIQRVGPVADSIAANIDHAAVETLQKLYAKATSSFKPNASQDEKDAYMCALYDEMEKATGHDDKITAVSTYWGYVRRST